MDGPIPVIGSGGISGSHNVANFRGPGIVIGRKGSYGTVHWVPTDGFAIDTAYYINDLLSTVELRWLYYAIQAVDLKGVSQDVGVPGLSRESAYSVMVPSPPIPAEQCRIADFLDAETSRIDRLVKAKEASSALMDERRTALISEYCLRGVSEKFEYKESGIGPIGKVPQHWKIVRNKTILTEVTDLSSTGDEEMLTVSHLTGVTPRSEKNVNMFEAESTVGYKICQPNDLIINTLWAWMGALGIARNTGIVSPAYGVYRFTSDDIDPSFFDYLYRTPAYVTEMTRFSKGVWTSRLRLYPESFLALRVPVPPRAEQVDIVSAIQREIAPELAVQSRIRKSVELLRERRQALITAAVTGQFDVSTASGRNTTQGV